MIEAWLWATPNSNRVSILLEELGLTYQVHPVNIRKREQFAPEVLALNPYGKIPIVRFDGPNGRQTLFESGAILIHFAEAYGRLLPSEPSARAETLAWLMVALTGLGPMTGQAHHWSELAPEKSPVALSHTVSLVERAYGVLDARLAQSRYLGPDYSIADIAAFPWIARHAWATIDLSRFHHILRWYGDIGAREAVIRGMLVPRGAKLED